MVKPSKSATFIKNPFLDDKKNDNKNRKLD